LISEIEPVTLDLHAASLVDQNRYEIRPDAKRFETWESSLALRLGLGAACDYALEVGLDSAWERLANLAATMRTSLAAIPGVTVHDKGITKGGIVTFTLAGRSASAVRTALAERRINVSITSAASARIDMDQRGLAEVVRASVHYFNTEDEIGALMEAVERLAHLR
jgi:selenocysteine lyase/cysteine desulfurase